jgi:hypothetical protein
MRWPERKLQIVPTHFASRSSSFTRIGLLPVGIHWEHAAFESTMDGAPIDFCKRTSITMKFDGQRPNWG